MLAIAGGVTILLICFAHGYGYHRDELYFLAAGRHLTLGYPDQGPLTPWLAHVFGGGSLTWLRVPSALAAGGVILATAATAAELGANRRDQCLAALVIASSGLVLFVGHTLSTSTFDLLVWSILALMVVRAVRTGSATTWLIAGVVLGIGLLNKPLPAFLAGALLLGLALVGPRRSLRSWAPWTAAALGAVLWLPWLIWQQQHGWPEFDVARSIASGGSTSSQPWWAIIPYQALLAGPPLFAVWIAGLVRLARDAEHRYLAVAWVVLAVAFMSTGGKPYYLAGLLPLLVAAGVPVVVRWLTTKPRMILAVAAVTLTALPDLVIALPIVPAQHASAIISMNPDVGETMGWPAFVDQVRAVYLPGDVIVTDNYGEAGAIDRLGSAAGLPEAYSGHNAYWQWGPPTMRSDRVLLVGDFPTQVLALFDGCRIASRIHTGFSNEENDEPIRVCAAPSRPWPAIWPKLLHYG
ncbi:MAG: ArnT family glycosyltransferase [Marmoricola sp.]